MSDRVRIFIATPLLTLDMAKVSRYATKYDRARIQADLKSHCVFSGKWAIECWILRSVIFDVTW